MKVVFAFPIAVGLMGTAAAHAQGDAAGATASLEIVPTVTVTNTAGLDFGQHPRSAGQVLSSRAGAVAAWNVVLDASTGDALLEFDLPSELLHTVLDIPIPITFGPNAAHFEDPNLGTVVFDPSPPGDQATFSSSFDVYLGADIPGDGSGDVVVDVTGAPDGVYTAVVTLTVTIP